MSTRVDVDVCIVGAGIAGLAMARKLLVHDPTQRVWIMEASRAAGGRASMSRFAGVDVVRGAGVGRLEKDHLLRGLLEELRVPFTTHPVHHTYRTAAPVPDVRATLQEIARSPSFRAAPHAPFRTVATRALGRDAYRRFVAATGYSDFERDDATDIVCCYGMEDNADGWTAMAIPWNDLARALVADIRRRGGRVLFQHAVTELTPAPARPAETTLSFLSPKGPGEVRATTVILATTIDTVRALLPTHPLYRHIFGQPFLRLYAQIAKAARPLMAALAPTVTVVDSPLQEIVPIDPGKGVYMIAYADNAHAKAVGAAAAAGGDPARLQTMLETALGAPAGSLGILRTQAHAWDIGTHGRLPLPRRFADRAAFLHAAQRPRPGVFVVGEAVARHPGWVNGALESVMAVWEDVVSVKPKKHPQSI